jgi:cell division protein FtsB
MGIVMTDQEIHAIAGKARADYQSAKKEYAALEAKAAELAKHANTLKTALENPSRIQFFTGTPITGSGWIMLADGMFQELSADNIKKLSADIKRVKQTRDALRKRVTELEGQDPEGGVSH